MTAFGYLLVGCIVAAVYWHLMPTDYAAAEWNAAPTSARYLFACFTVLLWPLALAMDGCAYLGRAVDRKWGDK